jgi:ParB-like chromosome segregation protein Spo0J
MHFGKFAFLHISNLATDYTLVYSHFFGDLFLRTAGQIEFQDSRALQIRRRRLEAAKALGWSEIPVRVLNPKDELDAKIIAFDENKERKALTDCENRRAIVAIDALMRERFGSAEGGERTDLHEPVSESERGWTDAKTAEQLGISTGAVSEAKQAEAFVQEYPELSEQSTSVILEVKKAPKAIHKKAAKRIAKEISPKSSTETKDCRSQKQEAGCATNSTS